MDSEKLSVDDTTGCDSYPSIVVDVLRNFFPFLSDLANR